MAPRTRRSLGMSTANDDQPASTVSRTSRAVFAGVVIPQKQSPDSAVSSPNNSLDSTRTPSVEDSDTPDTSIANSEFESFAVARSSKLKRTRSSLAATTHDTTSDERIAQKLQEEEYADIDNTIPDSESELSSFAEDSAFEVDEFEGSAIIERPAKRAKTSKSRSLAIATPSRPLRKARTSAEKAMKSDLALDLGVSDDDDDHKNILSEDEDDLTSLASFQGVSESEDDDEVEDDSDEPEDETAGQGSSTASKARRYRSRKRPSSNTRRTRGAFAEIAKRTGLTGRSLKERHRLEVQHPEIVTLWENLEKVPTIKAVQAPQPPGINRILKSFQREGVDWMRKQEQTQWRGGLLGDEMGMGKTIQAVSLIMSDYPQKQPTLVVVPPVALMQWSNEIKEYTSGKLKVLVYHGTNTKVKNMSVKELKSYDVIMVSYSSLESMHRKETKGWSRGDNIVKEDSAIHSIHFHRLILDEAHSIKSRTTGVAKACFALKGSYKWCLSGTPVQNRIGEFFSLLRYLEIQPFANYFCKSCPCSQVHWSIDARYRCSHCGHRALDHVSVFNQEILNPITNAETPEIRKLAFNKLRLLTDRIMLRRVKRDHTSSMELPPKEVIIHNEFFGEIERDFASSIMSNTARTFDTYVSRGVMLNNYANIFGLIMQMRQVADHPDLILRKNAEGGQNVMVCEICDEACEDAIRSRCKHDFCRACVKEFIKTMDSSGADPDCPRCHVTLSIDLEQPEIEQDEDSVKKTSIINRIKMDNWTSSTKIEMLVYDLWKLRSKKQTTKSIVFSQFTSMLQLVEWRLRRAGFNTVMLDGSMTPQQRQKSIEHFMTNPDVEVFLVSLKAGGVALNLTEASRCFIIDPWWNPSVETQAFDRIHRIGQKRPCVVTRLVIEDSLESKIVLLQEKKAAMISSTIDNDDVAADKLTPEDMQFLFRGS